VNERLEAEEKLGKVHAKKEKEERHLQRQFEAEERCVWRERLYYGSTIVPKEEEISLKTRLIKGQAPETCGQCLTV
jgi:hypothetical protein